MEHILFVVIVAVWCVIVAWLEVEIEGKDGWAKNAPTWKYALLGERLLYKPFGKQEYSGATCGWLKEGIIIWYIKNMCGGRDFTGYHRAVDVMQAFVGVIAVCGLFLEIPSGGFLSWVWLGMSLIARIAAFVMISWALEDTLWFRLNPFYKDGKRTPEWHRDWDAKHRASKGMLGLFRNGCILYVATCIAMYFLRR